MPPARDTDGQRRAHLTLLGGTGPSAKRGRQTHVFDPHERVVRSRLAAVTDRCWQCRTKVRGVVGVLVDPARTLDRTGFLRFDEVAELLVERVDPRTLAARRIGELRHRDSPGVAGGYVANGCIECDALIGRFQLEDLLHEHLQAGGTYAQLDIGIPVDLPAIALARRLSALG
ncbi:MAG TPA: hypothetical protein VF257_14715 [Solirubrobacteraceae bacterium]